MHLFNGNCTHTSKMSALIDHLLVKNANGEVGDQLCAHACWHL